MGKKKLLQLIDHLNKYLTDDRKICLHEQILDDGTLIIDLRFLKDLDTCISAVNCTLNSKSENLTAGIDAECNGIIQYYAKIGIVKEIFKNII